MDAVAAALMHRNPDFLSGNPGFFLLVSYPRHALQEAQDRIQQLTTTLNLSAMTAATGTGTVRMAAAFCAAIVLAAAARIAAVIMAAAMVMTAVDTDQRQREHRPAGRTRNFKIVQRRQLQKRARARSEDRMAGEAGGGTAAIGRYGNFRQRIVAAVQRKAHHRIDVRSLRDIHRDRRIIRAGTADHDISIADSEASARHAAGFEVHALTRRKADRAARFEHAVTRISAVSAPSAVTSAAVLPVFALPAAAGITAAAASACTAAAIAAAIRAAAAVAAAVRARSRRTGAHIIRMPTTAAAHAVQRAHARTSIRSTVAQITICHKKRSFPQPPPHPMPPS